MAYAAEERHPPPAAGPKQQATQQQLRPTSLAVVVELPNLSTVAF